MKPRHGLWEYGLAVILLAVAFCPSRAHPQVAPPIAQIVSDSITIRYLESIADSATVETARCLTGRWFRDTLVIAGVAETPWLVSLATDSSVFLRWTDCPLGTVALWHNHIAAWTALHYPGISPCYLGLGDQSILRTPAAPPVALVSVRRGLTCTFVRMPSGYLVAVPVVRP